MLSGLADPVSADFRHVHLQDQEPQDWREAEGRLCRYGGQHDSKFWELHSSTDNHILQHLFFDQNITTKFDLKGISTRVARAKGEGQTLWDADWVENFQTRLLVHAHEKT